MNSVIKSRKNSRSPLKRSDNKKSVSHDTVSDKKNQTKRLLTRPERDLVAEYSRCHPLANGSLKKKARAA